MPNSQPAPTHSSLNPVINPHSQTTSTSPPLYPGPQTSPIIAFLCLTKNSIKCKMIKMFKMKLHQTRDKMLCISFCKICQNYLWNLVIEEVSFPSWSGTQIVIQNRERWIKTRRVTPHWKQTLHWISSPQTEKKKKQKKITCDTWHLTVDTCLVTCDKWHMIHDRWGEVNLLSNFSSLALMVWEWRCFEDFCVSNYELLN